MTTRQIYNLLFNGGNFSKHYLIELSHPTAGTLRLVNNNEAISWGGKTFKVSTFDYTPPNNKGSGGSLEITSADNEEIFAFIENADDKYSLKVVGILDQNGNVETLKTFRHFYGAVSMGDDSTITFTLGNDDRLEMKFNPFKYDTNTNRGNA